MNDVNNPVALLVVKGLISIAVIIAIGGMVLAYQDKELPVELILMGTNAASLVGGMLAKTTLDAFTSRSKTTDVDGKVEETVTTQAGAAQGAPAVPALAGGAGPETPIPVTVVQEEGQAVPVVETPPSPPVVVVGESVRPPDLDVTGSDETFEDDPAWPAGS